ncbi:MAG TPA: response regulator, partial [Acidimicrobiia bacterium]
MILVVDDDTDLVEVVRDALEREGFVVDDAGDGETALHKIAGATPELVVLDLGLPKVRGLDVLRQVRTDNAVPVIVLSGQSDETARIIGLELGADD